MLLSGIIAITYNDGDTASSLKTSLWIFALAKLFPPAVSSTLPFFHDILDKLKDFAGNFVHFKTVNYPALPDHIMCLLIVSPRHS